MRTSKHSTRLGNKLIAKLVPFLRHPGFRGIQIKVISEIAGHADVRITLSVYGHVLPDMQGTAADSVDQALG
jgi:integrase